MTKTRIYRVKKEAKYTMVSNEILQRIDLSWKAKGIMVYVLSLPNDWDIYLEEIMKHSTDGKAGFRSGWKELEKTGYVKRIPVREKGKIVKWETYIYENVDTEEFSPHTDFLEVENLEVENQEVENRTLLITNSTNDLKDTNNLNKQTAASKSAKLESDFEKLWQLYPNKKNKAGAFKAYKSAIKDGVTNKQIQDGIIAYKQEIARKNTSIEYVRYGSSWFNQRGWEDEYESTVIATKRDTEYERTQRELREVYEQQ